MRLKRITNDLIHRAALSARLELEPRVHLWIEPEGDLLYRHSGIMISRFH